MFENLLTDEDNTSIDVLMKLLDQLDIESKTELEMPQIKILTKSKWFALRAMEEHKNKTGEELVLMTLEYYMTLKVSYKRKRSGEIIKGLSEMKDVFLQAMQEQKQGVK